ncbi:uncharacterized protein LOC101737286 isoform X1 [Bombyx mori]|uniref:Uncharacterized protein n=1 Tax=Bombyx mori TaxID=7091 RepID=A0A8R1WFT4_BOMMO|nr:uncharacterized protein LOC101737286 isoform X1 [Bombyx mori]
MNIKLLSCTNNLAFKHKYDRNSKMTKNVAKIDVKSCVKAEPPHPCDPIVPCDPLKQEEGECPTPSLCVEKLKNPAHAGEITKCLPGKFINVTSCAKEDPPHPCDALACNTDLTKRRPCSDPPLCVQRIKNPVTEKEKVDSCDTPE